MSRRRVLLISYYFPPLGGGGISRPRALFRHLNEFGYDCHVLTVKPVLYRMYEPELLNGLNTSGIFRSGSRDPSRLMYLLGVRRVSTATADKSRTITKSFFPDAKAGWIKPAVRLAKKLCRRYNYDLLVSTSPPVSAHVVARELRRTFDKCWVADFTDYWVSSKAEDYFESEKRVLQARRLLTEIREVSDSVVAVNASCGEYVGAADIIPNCYDSDLVKLWRPPSADEPFTIGVFGTLSELTPIRPLLEVLSKMREKMQTVFNRTKVLQVGQVDIAWLKRQLTAYSMEENFEIMQYQKRADAIGLLSKASVFYAGIEQDQGMGITPGRIYLLASSGRPLLTYAPLGSEIDEFVGRAGNAFRFDDSTVEQACDYLCRIEEQSRQSKSSLNVASGFAKQFSSDKMAERFAGVFDKLLEV